MSNVFATWILKQIRRDYSFVLDGQSSFVLLFNFQNPRLDVALIKVYESIYFDSSSHPDGLVTRVKSRGDTVILTPAQWLEGKRYTENIYISLDFSKLFFVMENIDSNVVAQDETLRFLFKPFHFPMLKKINL